MIYMYLRVELILISLHFIPYIPPPKHFKSDISLLQVSF